MANLITYEALYEILRKEKYEKELQKLEDSFFNDVVRYLEEKEALTESQKSKDSLFSKEGEKTQKQLENIKKILMEIYEKRENKIIQHALMSSRFNEKNLPNMLKEEALFYKQIKNVLNKYRKEILESLISKKIPEIKEESFIENKDLEKPPQEKENLIKLIRFLHETPQFIGDDLIIYGPFEKEDIASLPTMIADLIIKKEIAEEIKPENS